MEENRLKRGSRVLAYARVSTIDQIENTSIRSQIDQMENHAKNRGYVIVQIYQEAASGADIENRPQYLQLMEDLRTLSDIDGFIASKLDRVSRSAKDLLTTLDELRSLGKHLEVIEIGESPNTVTGRFLYTILAAHAEMERATIWERTQSGRLAKKSKGGYSHGAPPMGKVARNGRLMEAPSELTVIRLINQLRMKGYSYRGIADYLNGHQYPAKRGTTWHPSIIQKIVRRSGQDT